MTFGELKHFQCSKCGSQKLELCHSDGGCSSCNIDSYIEITCRKCGISEKYD
jgi:predicted nucleic-acid-binding Zn-ribbon protein